MKIQVDIPNNLNKKLKIDKINYGAVTLQEALIENLNRYYRLMKKALYNSKGARIIIE